MQDDQAPFDITFIGHICYDEITPFAGETTVSPGSAVLCGATVAARAGARTAVVTRMNPQDEDALAMLRALDVPVYITPTSVTTYAGVVHSSTNVDERQLFVYRDAGPFTMADMPAGLRSGMLHLAGISNHEFTVDFLRDLRQAGYALSLDLQSFVRVIGPAREIIFSDVADKQQIVSLLDVVKLDVVEAALLTGTRDLQAAARIIAGCGAREVLITEAAGATLFFDGQLFHAPFTNRTQIGRTGRGDTTISAYLTRRAQGPLAALRFAAALVSVKMETPGPFRDAIDIVEQRMADIAVHEIDG